MLAQTWLRDLFIASLTPSNISIVAIFNSVSYSSVMLHFSESAAVRLLDSDGDMSWPLL